ncbi:MAG: cyclohexanecarboxylate-CoA ligase [Curvibacter sp.]|nr:cyclohexanecarboxylate-CoA ligase [Curvibacter sp.]
MEFDAVLLPPRRATMVAQGLWHERTINDALADCLARSPDKTALTAVQVEGGAPQPRTTRFSYRELARMADRIAVGLARLGVGRNDVVACQLPNWWQFTLTYLACSRLGAVMNPLMHIFRERELGFMLRHGEAKVLIAPRQFRGFDFEALHRALQPGLPQLRHLVIVDGDGADSFEALLSGPAWEDSPEAAEVLGRQRPGPDDITQLIYTSGTTGEPKGVMHSANTTFANILPYARRLQLGADDVVLMASPMAHQTGFMYGLMMPIVLQASVVLQDLWEPRTALALIRREGCTFTMASTPFLGDLARAVEADGQPLPSLRTFLCAGAPIPGPLVEQARQALGAKIVSAWGMTENGAVTLTRLDDEDERSVHTDGCPLPGVELRIADFDGQALATGQEGRLLLRACSNFGGYLHRPQFNATDAEGWFDTGDLARLDERGYVRITGRSKDVIIRGGENIPVVEIEALLFKHPAIAMACIVAYPDERLGERACAVVVPRPGQSLDLTGLVDFLQSQQVARQYIPERLVLRSEIPATPSGKIQKFRLRQMLREGTL